ncbi:hypothetical protein R1T16_02555 [Flavobacterium sp. DG1-102-2]|uniref:exodeoxyribonuclease X C-terminal domain-containing protein n=1 Tax=Flavobacterium sp. DG1-102-2 TaxID=3081663 RepID=UPI00294A770C|nr:hypothetical protein [Flavobacterium sp. DG1-102-2]MDV6167288.1 hypothetical protein [Flavobacterium sp. DG1-102-2]
MEENETIIYRNDKYSILKVIGKEYIFTNNWKHLIYLKQKNCGWELNQDKLFLISTHADIKLSKPIFAVWFTGKMEFQIFNNEDYIISYQNYLALEVRNGSIIHRSIKKKFSTDFLITFGKYTNCLFSEVLIRNPSYIKWAIINVSNFSIPPNLLEKIENFNFRLTEDIKYKNLLKFLSRYKVAYHPIHHIYSPNLKNFELYEKYGYYLDEDYPYENEFD